MPKYASLVSPFALCASLGLVLSACSSDGAMRVGAIGPAGPAGAPGPQGEQGEAGKNGTPGMQGQQGAQGDDGNLTLGDAGTLSVGGLVGPNGVAGTGLLANTGDPDNNNETWAWVGKEAGEELVEGSIFIAQMADETAPGGVPFSGAVLGVLEDTGQTLIQTSNGDAYLVDGLLAAPGSLITGTVADSRPIGSEDSEALIALSKFSEESEMGQLVSTGLGSGGELASADVSGLLDTTTQTLGAETLTLGETLNETLPGQDFVSIDPDSSLGFSIGDSAPVQEDIAAVGAVSDGFDGGLAGALDPSLADGGDLGGALEGIAGGDDLTGAIEPVLAAGDDLATTLDIGGGEDLTGVIEPVLDPLAGDGDPLGDTLEGVTEPAEDLLGGLLGGGE